MKKLIIVALLLFTVPAFADTQVRYPTSDSISSGTWTPATNKCLMVDDPAGSPDDTTTQLYTSASGGYALFGFTDFSVPAGAVITNLTIVYRAKVNSTSGTPITAASIYVGGVRYDVGAYATTAYFTYTVTWVKNPKTSLDWTAEDINRTGTNPLTVFGVFTANTGTKYFTQCYAVVTYTPPASTNTGAALMMMIQ